MEMHKEISSPNTDKVGKAYPTTLYLCIESEFVQATPTTSKNPVQLFR